MIVLELYPPLEFKNGERKKCLAGRPEGVSAANLLEEVLQEINSSSGLACRPEDMLLVVDGRAAGGDFKVMDGQTVKIMLMAMGG
ncbi:MAG: hypothetical protein HPY89_06770 [Pelotomaculum sp.]|uniref:MoaD/ThiS family protein n=1 Tax=Pelotomaculum thermopropionicum (strain DSM 13744 / JCM 10971 / SI) TaxID=370438 RepID=A5D4Z6_PELTS|nr:hypothetical protein [Pelotomaculum sp.]BAF58674.1 hypothetical protein PTH_0493 [Pelotomaculum thermopropionicum SI]